MVFNTGMIGEYVQLGLTFDVQYSFEFNPDFVSIFLQSTASSDTATNTPTNIPKPTDSVSNQIPKKKPSVRHPLSWVSARGPKLPLIYTNYSDLDLSKITAKSIIKGNINVLIQDIKHVRLMRKAFLTRNTEFHTFNFPAEPSRKIVLKGSPNRHHRRININRTNFPQFLCQTISTFCLFPWQIIISRDPCSNRKFKRHSNWIAYFVSKYSLRHTKIPALH